jgi:hypothetical protein
LEVVLQQYDLVGGIPTPLKNMKVSWDEYSQLNGKINNVPNHQPVIYTPLEVVVQQYHELTRKQ